jgi:hypothetical protein
VNGDERVHSKLHTYTTDAGQLVVGTAKSVMLNEHDGKSIVTIVMQHAVRPEDRTGEEALAAWREMQPELQRKLRDVFVPKVKQLVDEQEMP